MTIEGFKRARELDSLINKAKEDKYCLENLASGIRKGDKAMTMPYCTTDYGEDV